MSTFGQNQVIESQYELFGRSETLFPSAESVSLLGGYENLPKEMIHEINRGDFYLGVEFYLPDFDDIFGRPDLALFRLSASRFKWHNLNYRDAIKSIPEMKKSIGKSFNSMTLELTNVERGFNSGSTFVFKQLIKGFRVAVRIMFPTLEDVNMTRLIWWGRVVEAEDLDANGVKINCSQEIGNFSYEVATQKYGASCPLFFGKGECLGNETLEQKSPLFRAAFNAFGQGGCNRTFQRCDQLQNTKFYQGQNQVVVTGKFDRVVKTIVPFLLFFKKVKLTHTPVPYTSKNQSTSDDAYQAWIYGRSRMELRPFTWVDIGTELNALMGACRGKIQGFYNITCHNPSLTLTSITQHLGELGGEGTQQPDPRFPESGYNSRLAYIGASYSGSPPDDEPEEIPITSAIIKGFEILTYDGFGGFKRAWSHNPVDVARDLITNFPYTVVKPTWFNETINARTFKRCFTVIEDDTDAEIPVITAAEFASYQNDEFQRFRSTSRYDANVLRLNNGIEAPATGLARHNVALSESIENVPIFADIYSYPPDINWGSVINAPSVVQSRTYLMYRYTTNLVIREKSKLSDILFSLVLPTFRGFLNFDLFGKVGIDCRRPADNTFIRSNTAVTDAEVPVTNVVNYFATYGYLLIGNGLKTCEVAKIKGIRYVNGNAETVVSCTSTGVGVTCPTAFIEREFAPAEITVEFNGSCSAGDLITLTFTEPNGDVLKWDYACDELDTTEVVAEMFRTRLMASPAFRESWTAEIFSLNKSKIYIRCQTGYIRLDRPLQYAHNIGEEILRVVEIYEDGKDAVHSNGIRDNMKDFVLNSKRQETYHGVKATYISAVRDFVQVEIQPRIAWDAAENERNMNFLELDLRGADSYKQAAGLQKAAAIHYIDGNLPAKFTTGLRGMFHEHGEVIAIRHQTMEGVSYTPFTVEDMSFSAQGEVTLDVQLYLSAEFDERTAKEEKFLETTLSVNENYNTVPPPIATNGGYSTTRTGDGAGDKHNDIKFETPVYETLPGQQKYSPHGRDLL